MREIAMPFVGAIIERMHEGRRQLLVQTRHQTHAEAKYTGAIEFPAGVLDVLYENVYDAIAREIKEETGLTLKRMIDDSQTEMFSPRKTDAAFGFRPFCCTQQLKEGSPWVGFIFRCEVEDGEPKGRDGETEDVRWMDYDELKKLFTESPQKLFTLEVPAWDYYFKEVGPV